MPDRPFHHGNLRSELLSQAARTLREDGLDQLSLRELARRAGVSHAAPRRHFPDRQALLDAVAADGFHRLTRAMNAADGDARAPYPDRFRAVANAFVAFATKEAALLELMFTRKSDGSPAELLQAASGFFAELARFYDSAPGSRRRSADADRRRRLLVPTLQGIAGLAAAGRISPDEVDQLLDDTTAVFA